MGQCSVALTGPRSSIGSPTTLRIRPRVDLPTGITIGLPVFFTGSPRERPSVVSMATVRTVFSPRCWATSRTRFPSVLEMEGLVTRSAVKISGRSPGGNSTSTTGPRIWVTFPCVCTVAVMSCSGSSLQRFGAGDDLHQFLGDHCLARAVVVEGQPGDGVCGVVGRVLHRAHSRPVLGGHRLE